MRVASIILVSFFIFIAGCDVLGIGNKNAGDLSGTGIVGDVLYGPLNPISIEGEDDNYRPHAAQIDIIDSNNEPVHTFWAGEDGQFEETLSPGTYTLSPVDMDDSAAWPRAEKQIVVVQSGEMTQVEILFDSGIR